MKQLSLSQGRIAIVDDEDFERLAKFKWFYRPERNGALGYAMHHVKDGTKYKSGYLHRAVMNPQHGLEVIFLNHDRLDCRKENLRVVNKEDARRHHRVRRDSESGVKGIRNIPFTHTWTGEIWRNGHSRSIGIFHSRESAQSAYEAAMKRENADLQTAPPVIERVPEQDQVDPIVSEQAKCITDQ